MGEGQADLFYESLMDLFYAKLFEFAQKRVKGSVNREYSADDVVGTTIRTLLRRKIHESPRIKQISGGTGFGRQVLISETTRIGIDVDDKPKKIGKSNELESIFVICEEQAGFYLRGNCNSSITVNSVPQEIAIVPLEYGDKFSVAGTNKEFLFACPHLPDELWPLLVTVALRKIAKIQRRKFSHLFINESALDSTGEFGLLAQLFSSAKSEKEAFERELRCESIRNGFRKLEEVAPERLLLTLEMRLNGMNNQEIAEELGLSVSRVKQLLKKIRDIIVGAMEQTYEHV